MDLRKIKKLIDLLNASAIGEIEVKSGDDSVRISKQSSSAASQATYQVATPATQHPTPGQTALEDDFKGIIEHSPMVGTIYLAKTPGAKPFAEVGQTIKAGDTLCIIEAMKVFNPIKASQSGTIEARMIEDGQPVEYDEILFTIIPD
jgi:acetyl-CoA carboxylase biotin carboxyl carrier protein